MALQSTRWCFTINNPTAEDQENLENVGGDLPGNHIIYLVFGREVGDNGTPHLQGFVSFSSRKRFATVRGIIGHRAHLEVARGTTVQAADYCKKDGDFVEFGNLPNQRERQPTVTDFCNWVVEQNDNLHHHPTVREIAVKFPGLYLRYGQRLVDLSNQLVPLPVLVNAPLNDWQTLLHNQLQAEADDRTITFYVDEDGGKGKSFFCRYYLTHYAEKTQVFSIGKRDDIAHAILETKSIFLFNMPRGGMEYLQYTILEQLKDRMIFSPKYNSCTKLLWFIPHVIVFCNEQPDLTKMSADRCIVITL